MVVDWYNSMWEFRDKRVDDWFLLSSLWPTFLLCMAYVFMVKIFGPAYMNQKEPMSLKGFTMAYNIVQVSACLYMIKQIWVGGWGTYYSYLCQPLDSDPHPDSKAMIMASATYWFYMSKLLDFVDTILFVLRKKNNQITTLHVFHHAIMPLHLADRPVDSRRSGDLWSSPQLLYPRIDVLLLLPILSGRLDPTFPLVETIPHPGTNGSVRHYFQQNPDHCQWGRRVRIPLADIRHHRDTHDRFLLSLLRFLHLRL
uniref:Elongation of very long chain fatty acids protein n=1 Tax=Caligus clemensi TaxID=344056 RepID=C1C2R4_CALCM|nr:Elongation of very long chain fatty acids protein AAEL008004 [Caligus clemensi]